MKVFLFSLLFFCFHNNITYKQAPVSTYLSGLKLELQKQWPDNRTINLVFHGHSVPTGYQQTPLVKTFESYPYLLLKKLKEKYPYAVINVIITSIGGENSQQGEARFVSDVLIHKPDVLFIDYALNDRNIGLEKSEKAWESMIELALKKKVKVVLLSPSPDATTNILSDTTALYKHAEQIRRLSKKYGTGLVDSYLAFQEKIKKGDSLYEFMAQSNHPNEKGNQVIADEIFKWF